MGQWLPDSVQARYEDARDQLTSNPATLLPGATLVDSDNMIGVVDGEPTSERNARLLDYQNQFTSNPATLLPGATLLNPDNRIGVVDGEDVGTGYDVDAAVADRFGLGEQLEQVRDLDPDDYSSDAVLPQWLQSLLSRPKALVTLVAGLAVLSVVGPLLDLLTAALGGTE
jgi:hypothetical protein